jgi:pyridoxine 5-phosphate synthase
LSGAAERGIALSVNVNKIATVRNSRGGRLPSVLDAVEVCIAAGAHGITVHPRADARHITLDDVREVAGRLRSSPGVEFNIEGDPRPELLDVVLDVRPTQCTLVPVRPGELTSEAGWQEGDTDVLVPVITEMRAAGIRVSLFVNPEEPAIRWAARMQGDRVELFTEPYARAFDAGLPEGRASFDRYAAAARLAHALGLGVNAGHDLDLANLVLFRELPHLAEVSIGHALVSHALFVGLERSVRDYLAALAPASPP